MRYSHGAAEPIAALNRVRLDESGEPLVDLRNVIPDLPILKATAVPWVREGVARRLIHAIQELKPYGIGLREGWRSLDRQKFIYDRYFDTLNDRLPFATRRRLANRFFAPYDQKAPPGHSTGGAIDVWLLDATGEAIALDGAGRRFKSAPTFSPRLPENVRRLRLILHDAMAAAGFTNCRDEWWHYSFGDSGWAVRAGESVCIYGAIAPSPEEYRPKDREFFDDFLADPPF
jgi:D-alanyl-D-alanine dipeptidase